MIQVYYGLGKGKTSSSNGMALRMFSLNKNIKIYRFLKGRVTSEDEALSKMGIFINKVNINEKFVYQMSDIEKDKLRQLVENVMTEILEKANKNDIYILDEFIDLSDDTVQLVSERKQVEFIKELNDKSQEIIITGHRMFSELEQLADLITLFENKKHYFDRGVTARKGFEY